ncbi:hypothetical protein ACWCOP_06480 [Maricaulaceae bacterium MS644]
MEFLDPVMPYVEPVWAWLMNGVETFGPAAEDGGVNWLFFGLQLGVIGLVMALLMPSYGAILIFTVASVIVHVVVDQVLPMVRDGASFSLPPVTDMVYWQYLAFAAGAYLIGLTVLYLIKSIVLPR